MSDDTQPVTKGDLRYLGEQLTETMRDGFSGVHKRQDITNGRVSTLEQQQGRQDERLKGLARTVYSRPATDHALEAEAAPMVKDAERRPITRREVYVFLAAIGGTVAVLRFFGMIVGR